MRLCGLWYIFFNHTNSLTNILYSKPILFFNMLLVAICGRLFIILQSSFPCSFIVTEFRWVHVSSAEEFSSSLLQLDESMDLSYGQLNKFKWKNFWVLFLKGLYLFLSLYISLPLYSLLLAKKWWNWKRCTSSYPYSL